MSNSIFFQIDSDHNFAEYEIKIVDILKNGSCGYDEPAVKSWLVDGCIYSPVKLDCVYIERDFKRIDADKYYQRLQNMLNWDHLCHNYANERAAQLCQLTSYIYQNTNHYYGNGIAKFNEYVGQSIDFDNEFNVSPNSSLQMLYDWFAKL